MSCTPIGHWGTVNPWGTGPWSGTGPCPLVLSIGPDVVDVNGGTVVTIVGTDFYDPTVIELYDSLSNKVGEAKYFEAKLDLRKKKIIAGFPALPAGSYGIRIITAYGDTGIMANAVTYKLFSEEGKVHRVRRRWAEPWQVGERLLK